MFSKMFFLQINVFNIYSYAKQQACTLYEPLPVKHF